MSEKTRVTLLKVLAVFFVLRGITNDFKFMTSGGMIFFGAMLDGVANHVVSQAFALLLYVYAFGLWTRRRFALLLGIPYFVFVVANVVLFPIVHGLGTIGAGAYFVFGVLAIGSNVLALWLLKDEATTGRLE